MATAKVKLQSLNPLERTADAVFQAVNEWEVENDPEHLKAKIKSELDKQAFSIAMQLLGFSDKWGKWEIASHSDSPIKKFVEEVAEKAAQEFLAQMPVLTFNDSLKKQLVNEVKCRFKDRASNLMYSAATRHIESVVGKEMQEVLAMPDLSSLKNIREFIKGNPT